MQTPILMTRADAARRLHVRPDEIDRLKLRSVRAGRRRMFRGEDVLTLARGPVPAAAEALREYDHADRGRPMSRRATPSTAAAAGRRLEFEIACIGVGQLAVRLGVSRRTTKRIIARGELPSFRIGRRRVVRLADARRWLLGEVEPTPAIHRNKPSGARQSDAILVPRVQSSQRPYSSRQPTSADGAPL